MCNFALTDFTAFNRDTAGYRFSRLAFAFQTICETKPGTAMSWDQHVTAYATTIDMKVVGTYEMILVGGYPANCEGHPKICGGPTKSECHGSLGYRCVMERAEERGLELRSRVMSLNSEVSELVSRITVGRYDDRCTNWD